MCKIPNKNIEFLYIAFCYVQLGRVEFCLGCVKFCFVHLGRVLACFLQNPKDTRIKIETIMFENYENEALDLLKQFKRISPFLIMRKFKLSHEAANKICQKIWLRQHLEARKLMKDFNNRG